MFRFIPSAGMRRQVVEMWTPYRPSWPRRRVARNSRSARKVSQRR